MKLQYKKSFINLLLISTLIISVSSCGGGETTPTTDDGTTKGNNDGNNGGNSGGNAGGNGGTSPGGNSGGSNGKTVTTISFIELNDLHANLTPHWEQVRDANGTITVAERGGLVRIAQKIEDIRASNPNTILMNIGDTYHGGAEAMFSIGNDIIAPVDALNIDVGVPGNWDYAYGSQVTNARFGSTQGTNAGTLSPNYLMLGANVTASSGQEFLAPTDVQVINGVTVGFIGLTSDIIEKMHRLMATGLIFIHGQDNYIKLLNDYSAILLAGDPANNIPPADIIVVMSELGIHKDLALANALTANASGRSPVDIFFSAHTHELTASNQQIQTNSGAIVVEAGDDGYLGQMDVGFDVNQYPVSFNWTVHNIDNTIQPDMGNPLVKNVSDLVTVVRNKFTASTITATNPISIPNAAPIGGQRNIMFPQTLKHPITDVIKNKLTKVDIDVSIALDRKNSLENSFNNAYTDLLRNFSPTQVDIAMAPGFRFDSNVVPGNPGTQYWQVENNNNPALLKGKITYEDVYRFINSPYFLVTSTTTALHIKSVIELNLDEVYSPTIFDQGGGWMFGFSGLKIEVDLTKPMGSRVLSITNSKTSESYYSSNPDVFATKTINIAGCGRPFDLANTVCSYVGFGTVTKMQAPNTGGGRPGPIGGGGGGQIGGGYAASDFFIDQLEAGNLSTITPRKDITDVSKTAMWPDTEFVQPLYGVK
jgi:2',3'-cyclic-nucleotide 2'-phosphodiesterase (5'-nucleotidase family)